MVAIVWRQQLVLASQDELYTLVNHGNADQHLSLHRVMHQLLSDLGRLVDGLGVVEGTIRAIVSGPYLPPASISILCASHIYIY
jgi:hypothetical protein